MGKKDFWMGLFIGAAAGVAGTILANTERGKALRDDLLARAKATSEKLRNETSERIDDARDGVADLIDDLRKRLETLEERPRAKKDEA